MLMGYREYARHRGCSLQAVQKALADGRISAVDDGSGRKKIDAAVADAAWQNNTDPAKRSPLFGEGPAGSVDAAKDSPEVGAGDDADDADPAGATSPEYRQARTEQLQIRVAKERMELEILQGRHIPVVDATRSVFTAFRTLRDRVLNVPVRVKHQLAGETDAERVEKLLEEELSAALTFDPKYALRERDVDDEDDDE